MSVGFINLGLSLVIFNLASARLERMMPVNLSLLAANALAFFITTSVAFLLNSRITFRGRHADAAAYCRYGLVSVVGFLFNYALTLGLVYLIAFFRHETAEQMVLSYPLGKNIAYLSAVGCVFFWNFFMSRHWVFPTPATAKMMVQAGR